MKTNWKAQLVNLKTQHQKALVIGLGLSGTEAIQFLLNQGVHVVAYDDQQREEFIHRSPYADTLTTLQSKGCVVLFGEDQLQFLDALSEIGLVIVSPGVNPDSWHLQKLRDLDVPVINDLELGLSILQVPSIMVTGTNGKTTTVHLLHAMFHKDEKECALVGNVGHSVLSYFGSEKEEKLEAIVAEASSYQLDYFKEYVPQIAVFLNLTTDHLERHGTMEEYFAAKASLFLRQTEDDISIINIDDPWGQKLELDVTSTVYTVSTADKATGAQIKYDRTSGEDSILLHNGEEYDLTQVKLLGLHNRYNIACAILAARLAGVSRDAVHKELPVFAPVPYRLEEVPAESGIIINDSKSTTLASTVAALAAVAETYPQKKITLLIGGRAKKGDSSSLTDALKSYSKNIKEVIAFGASRDYFSDAATPAGVDVHSADLLQDALVKAKSSLENDEIVLFSPGAASFDEFLNYVKRGEFFYNFWQ